MLQDLMTQILLIPNLASPSLLSASSLSSEVFIYMSRRNGRKTNWEEYNKFIGQKFGRLKIKNTGIYEGATKNEPGFLVECECGKIFMTRVWNIISSKQTKSCGCILNEITSFRSISHGMTGTKEHNAYRGILSRCNNPNVKSYSTYGGRGIKCLFRSFEEFFKEVGFAPTKEHQIDRIDNDGNYEKGNIRWVTCKENCKNKRHGNQYVLNYEN